MDPAPPPRSSVAQAWFARAILPVGLATPVLAPWIWRTSPALAVASVVGSHLPVLYGTFVPNRQLFGPIVTGFAGAPDEIWLTLDDGPDPEDTPRILDALDAAGARATFFVRGDRAQAHPALIAEIVQRGHSLGNHTFSHPQATFWGLSPRRIGWEMDRCSAALQEITGSSPRWFRAPVGMVNPFVHRAAHSRGMRVVGWSARAFDAGRKVLSPAGVTAALERGLKTGGIVLLHEGIPGAPQNVAGVLDRLRALNLRAVIPDDRALLSRAPISTPS